MSEGCFGCLKRASSSMMMGWSFILKKKYILQAERPAIKYLRFRDLGDCSHHGQE